MLQINFLTLEHDTEARSRNCFCRGKERSVAYSQSVIVTLVIQHAKHMSYHSVISGPTDSTIFFRFMS
jgi:hypothetical protein